jgi:hypothetical protein
MQVCGGSYEFVERVNRELMAAEQQADPESCVGALIAPAVDEESSRKEVMTVAEHEGQA